MNIGKLRSLNNKFPQLFVLGYTALKKVWKLKASFVSYEYPEDNKKATISYDTVLEFNKERLFGPKKRICYAAFNNMHFDMNGNVYGCSFNSDMYLGSITNNTIKEIWESENAQKNRNLMADYNMEKCLSCKEVLLAKNYSSFPGLKYDMFSDDDAVVMPTQMSFELSDLCNFACIMCNEDLSSSIKQQKNIPKLKNFYSDEFVNQLEEFIPNLKIATFIGGEPLLIKLNYKIWDRIITLNPKCKIHIQTNGSILNEKFLNLLELGKFEVGVSLDSLNKDTFEKIRVHSNFDTVIKNVQTLIDYHKRGKILMNINLCPLTLNWKEIPQMVDFSNKFNISLKIVDLERPYNLGIAHRKPEYLQQVYDFLNNFNNLNSSTVVSQVNKNVFIGFLNNILFFKQEAMKREDYINEISSNTLAYITDILKAELINNSRFVSFKEQDIENLLKVLLLKLDNEQEYIQKRTISFILYLMNKSKAANSTNEIKIKEVTSSKFLYVIEEIILLQKCL